MHFLQEIKEVSLRNGSPEWQFFTRCTNRLIRDALHLAIGLNGLSSCDNQRQVAGLHIHFANRYGSSYRDSDANRLANQLSRYYQELFTFLLQPGVSADNIHDEMQIRDSVVKRKNSYWNLSGSMRCSLA